MAVPHAVRIGGPSTLAMDLAVRKTCSKKRWIRRTVASCGGVSASSVQEHRADDHAGRYHEGGIPGPGTDRDRSTGLRPKDAEQRIPLTFSAGRSVRDSF